MLTLLSEGKSALPGYENAAPRVAPSMNVPGSNKRAISDRIVLPDGSMKDIHSIGHPVVDEAGDLIWYTSV